MDAVKFHKESIRAHSAKRFKERYGRELTSKIRSGFHRQIDSGHNAWLVALTRDRLYGGWCEIYFIRDTAFSQEPIVLVFRPDWMEIVTFMTPDFWRAQITGDLAEERRRREALARAQDYAGAPDLRQLQKEAAS